MAFINFIMIWHQQQLIFIYLIDMFSDISINPLSGSNETKTVENSYINLQYTG